MVLKQGSSVGGISSVRQGAAVAGFSRSLTLGTHVTFPEARSSQVDTQGPGCDTSGLKITWGCHQAMPLLASGRCGLTPEGGGGGCLGSQYIDPIKKQSSGAFSEAPVHHTSGFPQQELCIGMVRRLSGQRYLAPTLAA